MSATQFLNEVVQQGIDISIKGDSLKCKSNEPLSSSIINKLRQYKREIIKLLKIKPVRENLPQPIQATTPLEWIGSHRDILTIAGFTDNDLFNKGLPTGIAHLDIWKKDNLSIELEGDVLRFSWITPTGDKRSQATRTEERWRGHG